MGIFLKNRKSHYLHYEYFPQLSLINSLEGHYHLNLLQGTILRVWLEPLLYYHLHLLPSLLQHSPSVMLYNVLSNQRTTNCNKVSEEVPECAMAVSSLPFTIGSCSDTISGDSLDLRPPSSKQHKQGTFAVCFIVIFSARSILN